MGREKSYQSLNQSETKMKPVDWVASVFSRFRQSRCVYSGFWQRRAWPKCFLTCFALVEPSKVCEVVIITQWWGWPGNSIMTSQIGDQINPSHWMLSRLSGTISCITVDTWEFNIQRPLYAQSKGSMFVLEQLCTYPFPPLHLPNIKVHLNPKFFFRLTK